jgi:hypothetical protein
MNGVGLEKGVIRQLALGRSKPGEHQGTLTSIALFQSLGIEIPFPNLWDCEGHLAYPGAKCP